MKYKNITYVVTRILHEDGGIQKKEIQKFESGSHQIEYRRNATKYFFELFNTSKKVLYGSKWEINFSVVIFTEDRDLDFSFDRGDTYDLISIKSNKSNFIVNWNNLKLERNAAIDCVLHFWEFDFVETKVIPGGKEKEYLILDEGLFNQYEIEL